VTPIAERLALQLESEFRRMQDEWFFKWHFIGAGSVAEMDNFRGGRIRYGGLKFDGSCRLVYWDTISFYLRQQIGVLFDQVEAAISNYPSEIRSKATAECHALISEFASQIKEAAIDTDQKLRGNGFELPSRDHTNSWRGAEIWDIQVRVDGLRALYCNEGRPTSWFARAEKFLKDHKETIGWVVAVMATIFGLAKWAFSQFFALSKS